MQENRTGLNPWPGDASHEPIRTQVAVILSVSHPYVVPNDASTVRQTVIDLARYINILEQELANVRRSKSLEATLPETLAPTSSAGTPASTSNADEEGVDSLADDLDALDISNLGDLISASHQSRYFGKSSVFMLIKTAMDTTKEETEGSAPAPLLIESKRPEFWDVLPASAAFYPRFQFAHVQT